MELSFFCHSPLITVDDMRELSEEKKTQPQEPGDTLRFFLILTILTIIFILTLYPIHPSAHHGLH